MPYHRIYHTTGTFTEEHKEEMVKKITALYVSAGLPAFYVVVNFIEIPEKSFFVGGKRSKQLVRVIAQHLARQLAWDIQKQRFMEAYEAILAPFIIDRGYDCETTVEECDANMWRENGLVPPLPGSEAEKEWVRQNKPVPFTAEQNKG